jgi:hypothetical protein
MQVSYEVYALVQGRWLLDSRYGIDRRDDAIDEARALARTRPIEATKVVEEDYDEVHHTSTELTVFSTRPQRLKRHAMKSDAAAVSIDSSARKLTAPDIATAQRPRKNRAPVAELRLGRTRAYDRGGIVLASKLAIILTASFGFATLTTLLYVRILA